MPSRRERVTTYGILTIGSVVALYPFLTILLLALHEPGRRVTGFSIPEGLHLGNFARAWTDGRFGPALLGSATVSTTVVVVTVFCSTLAAYAFGTQRIPGGRLLFAVLLIGLVLPYEAIIIPQYYSMRSVGLVNTYWAVILPQIGLSLSFGTFWMRASFESVPTELSEAAMIDGANRWTILWRIHVPQVRPALLTLGVLMFMFSWNEFLLALVMIQDASIRTAPLALSYFAGDQRTGDPAVIAAAAVMVALPVLCVYVALQRRFINGMVSGAVKG